jgi:hypothetical protein
MTTQTTQTPEDNVVNDIVTTIIINVYGRNTMAKSLAYDLIEKMPGWDKDDREHQIMQTCWNWFSGGSTAEAVAYKIEMALLKEM